MSPEASSHEHSDHEVENFDGKTIPHIDEAPKDGGPVKPITEKAHHAERSDETGHSSRTAEHSNRSNPGSNWWPFGGTDQVSQLEYQKRELEKQVAHLHKVFSSRENDYRQALAEKDSQLSEKDAELGELKRTLCMYDECSEVDLKSMVDGINTRIQSLARNLAVKWVKASKSSGEDHKAVLPEMKLDDLKEVIGVQLVDALKNGSVEHTRYMAVFLSYAWQASIVSVVHDILGSFSVSLATSAEGFHFDDALQRLSRAVSQGEMQPAYGRWRLVTHKYLKQVMQDEGPGIQYYTDRAINLCQTATLLALKSRCPDTETFKAAFLDQTREIVQETSKLLTTIQERMVTTNYRPYLFKNGRTFRPEKMALGKQDTPFQNDSVVCTVALGMLHSRKRARENSEEEPPFFMFSKPQVFTEGNLNDLIAG
ncbi:hypothetical protein FRB90_008491 [Tulasnella sp. 427]|nr:hypothetical protein FRB90_008491 [Tulasnella sp. 427]